MLNEKPSIRITDIIYIGIISVITVLCYRLFYWMSIEYKGIYASDMPYYVGLPTSDNKEHYRFLGLVFDFIYRHTPDRTITGMVGFMALMIALIILANYVYIKYFTKESAPDRAVIQIASLAGIFMGPLYIPVIHECFYKNSFQSFAWQSPTQHSMMFFGILAVVFFTGMYEKSDNGVDPKLWILTMVTAALSAYSKPAFILDMIAAMIAIFLIDLFSRSEESFGEKLKKLVTMGCSLIPAGCFVVLIFVKEFRGEDHAHRGGITVSLDNILNYDHLLLAIISGLAFPLVVWAVNYRLVRNKRYKMPFWIFIMGILQWAPFDETGARSGHGNFSWGRQVGCYFLFLTGIAIAINNWKDSEFMKDRPKARKIYFLVISILLIWHVCTQIVYFLLVYFGYDYYI